MGCKPSRVHSLKFPLSKKKEDATTVNGDTSRENITDGGNYLRWLGYHTLRARNSQEF
mgnify:CR=1 FL=1